MQKENPGRLVPSGYYRSEPKVIPIMIEINRRLYMREPYGPRSERFVAVKMAIQKIVGMLIEATALC
jgi:hypothetical protein